MKKAGFLPFFILLMLCRPAFAQLNKQAAQAFIKRIVPAAAGSFLVQEIPAENGKDVFELQSKSGKIILRGNKTLSVASALGYYLKYYCRNDLSWNRGSMKLPASLPTINGTVRRVTPYQYRYYLNYCTFNYSMSWWNWDRWQKEIDWMALHGINMPLALTGEEAVWQQVYHDMGFKDTDLNSFFSGPAYFAWLWMGNLDGWGGPLPQHWINANKELQLKILERERAFGMTPVLPAFSGHVPPSFKNKFPGAVLRKTNWGQSFNDVYLLDPNDPLFVETGKKYIAAQTKLYGTDHLYSADTFNENTPPANDSSFLSGVSKKVFQSMTAADPAAVWIMQGWLFYNDSNFWQPKQIKALLDAVPGKHIIVLDLYSDEHPLWQNTSYYYGKPWIWNMLQNFGGNLSLHGRLTHIAAEPNHALHQSKNMVGIGLTPEAIEQNPVMYELMTDNTWRDSPIHIFDNKQVNNVIIRRKTPAPGDEPWLADYAGRRYGKSNPSINKAWALLAKSVYNSAPPRSKGVASVIIGRPGLKMGGDWRVDTVTNYNPRLLIEAWQLFIQPASALKESSGYQYDLVDITRQVLANYANVIEPSIIKAWQLNDTAGFKTCSTRFLQLMDDMDELLATRKDFLLGKWLSEARANGIAPAERDLYEFNARDIITLWGGRDNPLHEYSNRQWAGLIKGFYKPRWEMFFKALSQSMNSKTPFDDAAFENKVKDMEWTWVNSHDKYTNQASGNLVTVAEKMFRKYDLLIKKAYQ